MSSHAATIRLATVDDARPMCEVHVRAWQSAYRGIFPDALLDGLDVDERTVVRRRQLEDPAPGFRFWVLEAADELIGFVLTGPTRDEDLDLRAHEVYALYLEPDRIGGGFGRQLMEHALVDLRARGFEEVVLWVLRDNAATLRFYAKAGFTRDTRVAEKEQGDTGCLKRRLRRSL